ncbi:uncharacterized protein LOC132751890 [Ruditapes philippinarum]|uniref:uncharacterized protein LOC132751890 n=1 Tax=Ruditapes philippinarum TaxID=129788 RepID=UPI00295A754E|nr:uncharacterized protein LOC132751890 [Ruditapes philippinarum]XP_060598083.1 uncharacterized protein LOC132751890 [Ruditapes philippinarum]
MARNRLQDIDVIKVSAPVKCFPRYQYMLKMRKDLAKRYNCLMEKYECDPLKDDLSDENVCIFMCKSKKSKEPFIDIELIVSPRHQDSVTKREYQAENENELKSVKGAYFIFLGDEDTLTISKDFHERTIVIGKDKESEYILTQILGSKERIGDCLYDDLFKALSIHLERFALTGMRSACENLYSVLTDNDVAGELSLNSRSTESTKQRPKSDGVDIKANSAERTPRPQSEDIKQSLEVKNSQDKSRKRGIHANFPDADKELIERLHTEFVGIFNRSILPNNEKPCFAENLYKIDKTMLQELKMISHLIRSCGYRWGTFQINVNDEYISDDIKKGIDTLMKTHNITKYSLVKVGINQCSTCHVGQGVKVEYGAGTLGGFAKTSSEESERAWAILSRHVAQRSSDRNLYIANDEKTYIGKVMKEVIEDEANKQYLDIAAASLQRDISFDSRYITEEGSPVPGKPCDYDTDKLRGLNVHIKGATTRLGLGTITMPEQIAVQTDNLDENYIIVEDRHKGIAFCQAGDSGAIVCADNPDKYGEEVQLISMVVGENINKPASQRQRSYTTVRLDKGLEQLKSLTEKDFHMC